MPAEIAHISLNVDVSTSPIEGSLSADGGIPQPFVGYMQLVTMLEHAVDAARTSSRARERHERARSG